MKKTPVISLLNPNPIIADVTSGTLTGIDKLIPKIRERKGMKKSFKKFRGLSLPIVVTTGIKPRLKSSDRGQT